MKNLSSAIALAACCLMLSNCGGGGGGGSDSTPSTIRPKTLDGIVLTLNSSVRFEFVRNIGSAPAVASGDVETGVFFYTLGGVQLRQYPNTFGDNSDVRYPDAISTASYTYRAINESSGVLTLTGFGVNDLNTTGSFNANNGSFVYFFNTDSTGADNNVVVIDLTFAQSGSFTTTNTATVMQPGGDPRYDTVIIPTGVTLAAGGNVPINYNPVLDPNRPSRIAPASLNNKLLKFTNGIPDPNFDFTIQFVADTMAPPGGTELGQGLLRVAGSAVDNAVDYTYMRTPGTDDAVLVISNANNTFDGSYTLKFDGTDNGAYIGTVDAGTANAAEVSGRFFIPGG